MATPFDVITGCWYRFDQYELRDGLIRPADGAVGEWYDPWDDFRLSREPGSTSEPPYQSLLNAMDNVSWPLQPARADGLLAWCEEYGLLGVLPHQVLMVTTAPAVVSLEPTPVIGLNRCFRTNLRFLREQPPGWLSVQQQSKPQLENHGGLSKRGQVPQELVPRTWPSPHVLMTSLEPLPGHAPWSEEPLSQTWARFFPDVPQEHWETYRYPTPLTEDFWRQYAEPLDQFARAASILRRAFDGLREDQAANAASAPSWELPQPRHEAWLSINSLVSSVSPALEFSSDGKPHQEWQAPSLIAHFAMMLLFDVTECRRLLSCAACDRLFTAKSPKARYCSDRCRERMQKRRYRADHPS
jgi:hypothetical protein